MSKMAKMEIFLNWLLRMS